MNIELDTSRLSASFQTQSQDIASGETAGKVLSALFGKGSSVTVTSGARTDLEALVEKLRNENERAKFSVLLTSLAAIGQSLTDTQKRTLEQGLALSEKLEALTQSLEGYAESLAKDKAEAILLQAKIDSLQKQIDQAVQDGKDHNKLVEEQERARAELRVEDIRPVRENEPDVLYVCWLFHDAS